MTHAFIPQHFLIFAKYLNEREFDDEKYDLQCINRSIVNRAYISTYLQVRDWIIDNGPYNDVKDYSKRDIGYHAAILVALNHLGKENISSIYADFIKLRVAADYDIVRIISSEDANLAINLADKICNALN